MDLSQFCWILNVGDIQIELHLPVYSSKIAEFSLIFFFFPLLPGVCTPTLLRYWGASPCPASCPSPRSRPCARPVWPHPSSAPTPSPTTPQPPAFSPTPTLPTAPEIPPTPPRRTAPLCHPTLSTAPTFTPAPTPTLPPATEEPSAPAAAGTAADWSKIPSLVVHDVTLHCVDHVDDGV